MLGHDELRGAVEIAGARVVTEARPEVQHFIKRRGRQRGGVGKALDEAVEIPDHGGDLGLLQHDLGHPHAIRRGVALPGQIVATVACVPGEQRRGNG